MKVSKFKNVIDSQLLEAINARFLTTYDRGESTSYLSNFFRIHKWIFRLYFRKNYTLSDSLDITLPYYKNDIVYDKLPVTVVSVDNFGICFLDVAYLLRKVHFIFFKIKKQNLCTDIWAAVSVALVLYMGIKNTRVKFVRFHYYASVATVQALLLLLRKDKNIVSEYAEYANFIDNSMSVSANILSFSNELISNYAEYINKYYKADRFYARNPVNYYSHKFQPCKRIKEYDIGFYSSGMYARENNSTIDNKIIMKGIEAEINIVNILKIYAKKNPQSKILIIIHTARNIESKSDAVESYKDILLLPNVYIDYKSDNVSRFTKCNLGVVSSSNAFWDRFSLGLKTIIIDPFLAEELIKCTCLNNVHLKSNDKEILLSISKFINMDVFKFYKLIFP